MLLFQCYGNHCHSQAVYMLISLLKTPFWRKALHQWNNFPERYYGVVIVVVCGFFQGRGGEQREGKLGVCVCVVFGFILGLVCLFF